MDQLDLTKLDLLIIQIQPEYEKAMVKVSELQNRLEELKWELDVLYANLDKKIRSQSEKQKLTETQIRSQIITDDSYVALMDKFLALKRDLMIWKARKEILFTRLEMIGKLIKLLEARYYGEFVTYRDLEQRMDTLREMKLKEVLK